MTASPFRLALAGTAAVTLAMTPAVAAAAPADDRTGRFHDGAPGTGDPYFPLAGNGGIDVLHYDLDLTYRLPEAEPAPLEGQLDGVATIDVQATQNLRRFNLDLRGLTASKVVVNGREATFEQEENELRISPRRPLFTGDEATVEVTYGGATTRPTDIEGALYGWVTTRDGAMVVSEPDGSATWFPVSDHPTDKASYAYEITVPEGSVAVANGLLAGSETHDGWTTWTWDAPDPMAAYLATATVGNFEFDSYVAANGTPIIDAVDADLPDSASADLALTSDMLAFFEEAFGPYPFNSYGAIVDDDSVGYALETQTRSFFSRRAGESTIAHELAHQWMGNHVSPGRWADIWLNEGWASYSSWMWSEEQGSATAQESFEDVMAIPADDGFWDVVVADPGPLCLFCGAIYDRGAATLHALRVEIGDESFFELAKSWVEQFGGGSATTADFTALAEDVSGQDLDAFFQVWLHDAEKPTDW